jgi:hypothetical protein
MPRNDPTETGGLFVGRRPGTAPLRYREQPVRAGATRQRFDSWLSAGILTAETLLCLTVWGPQPVAWLWVGSQIDYQTDSIELAIVTAFAGMLLTLMITLALAKQLDHAWKLARRAAGYQQKQGALEWIFVITLAIVGTAFAVWFFVIQGPGPSLAPKD